MARRNNTRLTTLATVTVLTSGESLLRWNVHLSSSETARQFRTITSLVASLPTRATAPCLTESDGSSFIPTLLDMSPPASTRFPMHSPLAGPTVRSPEPPLPTPSLRATMREWELPRVRRSTLHRSLRRPTRLPSKLPREQLVGK